MPEGEEELPIPARAQDRGRDLSNDFERELDPEPRDFFDDAPLDFFRAHDPAAGNFVPARFELRFDEHDQLGVRREQAAHRGHDESR